MDVVVFAGSARGGAFVGVAHTGVFAGIACDRVFAGCARTGVFVGFARTGVFVGFASTGAADVFPGELLSGALVLLAEDPIAGGKGLFATHRDYQAFLKIGGLGVWEKKVLGKPGAWVY